VWIDQGGAVSRDTLVEIHKRTNAVLVHYTPDSLRAPGILTWVFRRAIQEYDFCITTKRCDMSYYTRLGARSTLFTYQGVDPDILRPIHLSPADRVKYSCDVVAIGQAMNDRASLIATLARETDAEIRVYGRGWRRLLRPYKLSNLGNDWLFGEAYARGLCGAKIALGLLNEAVSDQHTSRNFEITSCGVLMLAKRTAMLTEIFREGIEAVYFDSPEELIEKVRYYLSHPEERESIAQAGRQRVCELNCSWRSRIAVLLGPIVALSQRRRECR
jgi:spore maturation protein CgeB